MLPYGAGMFTKKRLRVASWLMDTVLYHPEAYEWYAVDFTDWLFVLWVPLFIDVKCSAGELWDVYYNVACR